MGFGVNSTHSQWLKWPGQAGGSEDDEALMGLGNLAHFMHRRPLFHYQQGGSKQSREAEPPWPPSL